MVTHTGFDEYKRLVDSGKLGESIGSTIIVDDLPYSVMEPEGGVYKLMDSDCAMKNAKNFLKDMVWEILD